jgi:hypothetical protein
LRHTICYNRVNSVSCQEAAVTRRASETLMQKSRWRTDCPRWRRLLVMLTVLGHLLATFGLPLPAPRRTKSTAGIPYPCQNRPCGCLSSEQCWQSCCCFTLQERLAWARANGVEPPAFVRQLAQSATSVSPRPATPESCCCDHSEPAAEAAGGCSASGDCMSSAHTESTQPLPAPAEATPPCPHCVAKSPARPSCCQQPKASTTSTDSGVRWTVGLLAHKCRGEGLAGLFQLKAAVVSDWAAARCVDLDRGEPVVVAVTHLISIAHAPPTPPPRPF